MAEERKTAAAPEEKQPARPGNWITDIYDRANVPVRVLDAAIVVLGIFILAVFILAAEHA